MSVEILELTAHETPVPNNEQIVRKVEVTEKIASIIPLVILAIFFVIPTIGSLIEADLFRAFINGVVSFLICGLIIKVAEKIIVRPMRYVRYKAAAQVLQTQMQSLREPASLWRSWFLTVPGALAITRGGHLVIVDRSTDYNQLWLNRQQIVSVSVEREATHIAKTSHGSSLSFGWVSGGGFLSAWTMGRRSTTRIRTVETAFLEIRYRFEQNGAVYTAVVPFGEDRRGADELLAAIMLLEPVG
ncbi:hypothetical protein ABNQ39_29955 [Azospirillum sp. A26]|uniref:hypothetical protein n=1 Tax=Azospirillum sp. A26 TaxID=3160607 RepID=UPI003671B132